MSLLDKAIGNVTMHEFQSHATREDYCTVDGCGLPRDHVLHLKGIGPVSARLTTTLVIKEIQLLMTNNGNLNVEIQSLPDGKDVAARLQRIIDLASAIAKNAKRLQEANK